MYSWTSMVCPFRELSIPAKISADACKLASTCVSISGPPSSHLANFSISQLFSHFGWVRSWIFWPWPSRLRWRARSLRLKISISRLLRIAVPSSQSTRTYSLVPVVQSDSRRSTNPRRLRARRSRNSSSRCRLYRRHIRPRPAPGGGCRASRTARPAKSATRSR